MSELDATAAQQSRSYFFIRLGALASTAYFITIMVWVSQSLTFFWDDYEVIGLISEHPIEQLFINGVGHFGPIWRLFFLAEVYVFGPHYFLYTATSALLAAIGFWGFAWSLKPALQSNFWLVVPASVVYFTSLGAMAQIVVAVGSEFTLAFAFAGAASYVFSRTLRFKWPLVLMLLSGLSLNGTLPVNYAMFCGVVITFVVLRQIELTKFRLFAVIVGGLGLSVIWLAASAVLGALNPSPYYADSVTGTASVTATNDIFGELWNLITTVLSLSISWISAPFIPTSLISPDLLSRVTILVITYLGLFVLMAVVAGISLILILRDRNTAKGQAKLTLVFMWLVPIFTWASLVAYTRPGAIVTARYANVWLPAALLLSLALLILLASRNSVWVTRFVIIPLTSLVILNSVIGLVMAPQTAMSAANIERPRLDLSRAQHDLMYECLVTDLVNPYDDISPRLSGEDFCAVSRFLLQETLPAKY